MSRFFALVAPLLVASLAFMPDARAEALVTLESKYSVKDTLDRLTRGLEAAGIKVAARVDHAAGAAAVGSALPPTEVVIFGNPKLGTPLMQSNPMIGADLPLKVLAWQNAAGKVMVGYTSAADLKKRFGIADKDAQFDAMAKALDGLTKAAAQGN
ncbi:MAG: DUF302 domain-containing protein [Hyphomicrobiaceae bacterium]